MFYFSGEELLHKEEDLKQWREEQHVKEEELHAHREGLCATEEGLVQLEEGLRAKQEELIRLEEVLRAKEEELEDNLRLKLEVNGHCLCVITEERRGGAPPSVLTWQLKGGAVE